MNASLEDLDPRTGTLHTRNADVSVKIGSSELRIALKEVEDCASEPHDFGQLKVRELRSMFFEVPNLSERHQQTLKSILQDREQDQPLPRGCPKLELVRPNHPEGKENQFSQG